MSSSARAGWVFVLSAGLLAACQCSTQANRQSYQCSAPEDCANGFGCVDGICVSTNESGGGAAAGGGSVAGGGSAEGGGLGGLGGGAMGGGNAGGGAGGGGSVGGGSADGGGAAGGGAAGGGAAGGGAAGGGAAGGGAVGGGAAGGGAAGGGAAGGGAAGGGAAGGGNVGGGFQGLGGGGNPPDCVPFVTVSDTDTPVETALLGRGMLSFMYNTDGGQLVYGECASGCATQSPTFSTQVLFGPATHLSMAPRVGGGVVAAATIRDPQTGSDVLYLECPGNCTAAGAWTKLVLESMALDVRPAITTATGLTAVAYGTPGGLIYAECPANCTLLSSWRFATVSTTRPVNNVGVGLQQDGGATYRYAVSDTGTVFNCNGACMVGFNSWPSLGQPASQLNLSLGFVANPILRLAGTHGSTNIHTAQCTTVPCTNFGPGLSTGVGTAVDWVSVDVSPDDRTSVLYTTAAGPMIQLLVDHSNLAAQVPVSGCGQPLFGDKAAHSYGGPDGGAYVLFGSPGGGVMLHAP